MLHAYDDAWPLVEDLCPCDIQFLQFLETERIRDASIFHFGTGAHHHVGIRIAESGSDNSVLGITASRGEYEAYIDLAMSRPEVSRSYKAFFGDIYLLDARL